MDERSSDEQRDEELPGDRDPRPPIYHSSELFRGHGELWIEHAGEMYRLRKTARGKLYLTK